MFLFVITLLDFRVYEIGQICNYISGSLVCRGTYPSNTLLSYHIISYHMSYYHSNNSCIGRINKHTSTWTHRGELGSEGHDISPGITEHMGQVKEEVDKSTTGSSQISSWEKDTDEEALHDCGYAEHQQEHEDHWWVAISDNLSVLQIERQMQKCKNIQTRTHAWKTWRSGSWPRKLPRQA